MAGTKWFFSTLVSWPEYLVLLMLLIDRLRATKKVFTDESLTMKIAFVHLYFVLFNSSESFRDIVASDVAIDIEWAVDCYFLLVVIPLCLNHASFYSSMGLWKTSNFIVFVQRSQVNRPACLIKFNQVSGDRKFSLGFHGWFRNLNLIGLNSNHNWWAAWIFRVISTLRLAQRF